MPKGVKGSGPEAPKGPKKSKGVKLAERFLAKRDEAIARLRSERKALMAQVERLDEAIEQLGGKAERTDEAGLRKLDAAAFADRKNPAHVGRLAHDATARPGAD